MCPSALETSERRFRAIAEQAFDLLMIVDGDHIIRWANGAFERVLGYPVDDLIGSDVVDLVDPADRPALFATIGAAAATPGAQGSVAFRMRAADGRWGSFETSATNLLGDPAIGGFVVSLRDVSERDRVQGALHASEERYRTLVERAPDAIYTADLSGRLTSVNASAERITGYARDELLGMTIYGLLAPEERQRVRDGLADAAGGDEMTAEVQLIAKDRRRVCVQISGRVISANGGGGHIEGIARDTTERHRLEDELRHEANHDDLTGLPNRSLFLDRLHQALARTARNHTEIAVMLLDIDDFKLVNDALGHGVGDDLLIEVAARLSRLLRGAETVARLGGDEFALVAEDFRSRRGVIALAERVCSCFLEPFSVGGGQRSVTGSLGIAMGAADDAASDLLRDADTAMYRAKSGGKGSFAFFDAASRAALLRRLTLTKALEQALEERTLAIHYQPIVSLADGEILAIEALARWSHAEWGVLSPDEFIPLAEETGLIVPLGRYVIEEAAEAAAGWRALRPDALPLGLFVNVSPRELSFSGFAGHLQGTLARHGLDAGDIAVELTERVFIEEDNVGLRGTLAALAVGGVRIVLDDFGTGYSSLAAVKRFPLAALKIDRFFIGAIDSPHSQAPVTRAIIGLGNALGLTVVAEGVETEIQRDYLRHLGCAAAQGHLLGRPLPAECIAALLVAEPRLRGGAAAPRGRATGAGAPIPEDDDARLESLRTYDVLDSDPERGFDELAELAAEICHTPMAFVSLVDRDREFYKAAVGSERREAPRDISFCGHAIVGDEPLVVPDTLGDARFAHNPDVVAGAGVRFYAGVPLMSADGYALGALCVKDTRPRHLSRRQLHALAALGRQAVALLELRRVLRPAGAADASASGARRRSATAARPRAGARESAASTARSDR